MKEDIFKDSIDCVTNKPFEPKFKLEDGYIGEKLDKIIFYPMKVGTMFKIQPLLSSISELPEILKDDKIECSLMSENAEFFGEQLKVIKDNQDAVLEIICLAQWNKSGDYPSWYKEFFKWNMGTYEDMFILLRAIISRTNAGNFIASTMMIKKSMGLITKAEIIAASIRCS